MTTKTSVADPKVVRTLRHSWLLHALLVIQFPGLQLVPSDGANVPHACEYFPSLIFNFLGTRCTHKDSINSFTMESF